MVHCDYNENETAFGEMRIRVGGSLQDQVLYKVGNSLIECSNFKRNDDGLFGFTQGCLQMDRWDQLHSLFNQTGYVFQQIPNLSEPVLVITKPSSLLHRAKVTFGLNALFGRKKSKTEEGLWIGDWNAKNSYDLMKYSIEKGYKIDS